MPYSDGPVAFAGSWWDIKAVIATILVNASIMSFRWPWSNGSVVSKFSSESDVYLSQSYPRFPRYQNFLLLKKLISFALVYVGTPSSLESSLITYVPRKIGSPAIIIMILNLSPGTKHNFYLHCKYEAQSFLQLSKKLMSTQK